MRSTRLLGGCAAVALAGIMVSAALATSGTTHVKPVVSAELVRNGGAEAGRAVSDATSHVPPAGWATTGNFTEVKYSAGGGFPTAAASTAIHGGKQFFAGGPNASVATATQVATVPAAFRKADLKVTAKLSAALGGYAEQLDAASVRATFLDGSGAALGTLGISQVSHGQRGNVTKLVSRTRTKLLPAGTTSIKVVITARPLSGGYVDGYADNISLHLLTG